MLELKIINTEDARITCMQEPVKGKQERGEQGAWDKSLNGHEREETTDMLTDNVLTICNVVHV